MATKRTKAEAPKKMGRPSSYTQQVADIICERLMDGESLRSICEAEEMPSRMTVFRWLQANQAFRDQYAHAREVQADTLADDVLDIADDGRNDWMERRGEEDAGWVLNGEHVQRSRLRIDARKWKAAKLAPKKYGDKVQQEVTGTDGGPVRLLVERRIVDPASNT